MALLQQNDFDGAIKAADGMIAADPAHAGELGVLEFEVLLKGKKDVSAAAKKADEIAPKVDDAEALNMMAWTLATTDEAPSAETAATAQKLVDAALVKKPDNAEFMDTAARVAAVKKDFKTAADIEAKAIDKCADASQKPDMDKALAAYKAGHLPDGATPQP